MSGYSRNGQVWESLVTSERLEDIGASMYSKMYTEVLKEEERRAPGNLLSARRVNTCHTRGQLYE